MRDGDDLVSEDVMEGLPCTECGGARNVLGFNRGNSVQAHTINGGVRFCACSHDPQKDDVALLRTETEANLNLMAGHLTLPAPDGDVEVERELFHELVSIEGDFLLTGDPGIGKTALMRKLAQHYRDRGHDVVLLDASTYPERVDGRLVRNLETVLGDWKGDRPGHLFIDALDGDRAGMAEQLARTVELLADSRWRTVASARLYDITHNRRWRRVFAGAPVVVEGDHRVKALEGVRHFRVTGLTDTELARVGTQVPGLGRVLTGADTDLLSNPFNLSLACELLNMGAWPNDWNGHLDQSALLTHYWNQRVMNRGRFSRMKLLQELCRLMLTARRLQVSQGDLESEHVGELSDLVSNGVLREIAPRYANAMPSLAFGHHIFFDYAVSRLIFSDGDGSLLVRLLNEQPNLVFVARPAIDLHLTATWHADSARELFAEVCRGLARTEHDLAGVTAANIAVGLARSEEDVDWLVSALLAREENAAERVVDWVIGVLRGREGRDTESRRAVVRVWTSVATALAHQLGSNFRAKPVNLLYQLLQRLHEIDPLGPEAEAARARAECVAALMSTGLEDTVGRAQVLAMASRHLAAAIAVDGGHAELLLRTIRDEFTRRRNADVFRWLVRGSVDIARGSPEAAAELLEMVWALKGSRDEKTVMMWGVVSLSSTLAQDFEGVRYEAGQVFPEVLPLIGVEAACRTLATATHEDYCPEAADRGRYPLHFHGETGQVVHSLDSLEHTPGYRAPMEMLSALLDWAEQAGVDGIALTVRHLVQHVWHPGVWTSVMERARGGGPAWQAVTVELLSSGALLANPVTRRTAAGLLGTLSLEVDDEGYQRLEDAVLAAAGISSPDARRPDTRVIDELVSYLDTERLTRPLLIERLREVERLDEPPEVFYGGIVSGFSALTPQERFGEVENDELGEARLSVLDRMSDLSVRLSRSSDQQEWEELGSLFLEVVHDPVLLNRVGPGAEDAVAATIVSGAERLAGFEEATPGSKLGRQVHRVLLLAIGQEPGAKEVEE